ncbi:O-methyltransferase [Pseudomonas syringae]|uniref:O-methyltransferase n=1 Tax=Pseudomonas syringae TaxID=317 RepID=UPI0011D1146B|nr:O-methyltransferase [Pseudomonas syringae]
MSEAFKFPEGNKSFMLNNERVAAYAQELLRPVPDRMQDIVAKMADDPLIPPLQISPIDGRNLELLSSIIQPKKVLEIGTLFGFSAYFLSQGLAIGGHLYTIEVESRLAEIARINLALLGKKDVVTVIEGDARLCLNDLEGNSLFDIIFIDADKKSYPEYLKWAAKNLRSGGLLIADNTFGWGYIADPDCPAEILDDVLALRKFNYVVANSPLFLTTMLPTFEGMTVAMRR